MKRSNKILIGLFATLAIYFIGGKIAERMVFADRKKIEFEPGLVEKAVKPFKIIILDTQLSPNSELIIQKSDRFAVAADPNFWDAATFTQRGDTIFVQQFKTKIGRLADSENRDVNDYGEIKVLCPGGIDLINSDISVRMDDLKSDSTQIIVEPNRNKSEFSNQSCVVVLKNVQSKSLQIIANANAEVIINEKTQLENLHLTLQDSSSADVKAFIGQEILAKCAPKSSINLSGANISKMKKE